MINSQVSHYRLIRKLGAGTFGEVYEGVHVHSPDLRVAIKVVAPALVRDAQFVDALKRECLLLDKLDHPNVVRFRDLVVNDGQVAMVLELLSGKDLHQRLESGPLPIDTAVAVLEAMLEGLAYAHANGILHRDIKPGNVYVCDDGRTKLLDFGIARAADGAQATKTGHVVGTLDYMAPERFNGQHGSAASDVYAVGLIAWELLTARTACPDGELGPKMKWHMMSGVGNASAVRAAAPACPAWLAEVVATLSATEMSERPADGGAALALLREKRDRAGELQSPVPRRAPPSTVDRVSAPPGSTPPVRAPAVSTPPAGNRRRAPPGTVTGPGLATKDVPSRAATPKLPTRLVAGAVLGIGVVLAAFALGGSVWWMGRSGETQPEHPVSKTASPVESDVPSPSAKARVPTYSTAKAPTAPDARKSPERPTPPPPSPVTPLRPDKPATPWRPTEEGICADTTVKSVGPRLMDGDAPMWEMGGISISFDNGLGLTSYNDEPVALREKSGDEVQVCLISVPKNCPKGDDRGKVYSVYDKRQKRAYKMADSQHECGGA